MDFLVKTGVPRVADQTPLSTRTTDSGMPLPSTFCDDVPRRSEPTSVPTKDRPLLRTDTHHSTPRLSSRRTRFDDRSPSSTFRFGKPHQPWYPLTDHTDFPSPRSVGVWSRTFELRNDGGLTTWYLWLEGKKQKFLHYNTQPRN